MGSDRKTSGAPGLKQRRRTDGTVAWYWVASAVSRNAAAYPQKAVRLHGDREAIEARARLLTAELREWLAREGDLGARPFDGTIASLVRCYQRDEDSPYHAVKRSTRIHDYDPALAILETAVGAKRIDLLTRKDFARWHRQFREPAAPGRPERLRRAQGAMKLLRIICNYGLSMRYPGCRDVAEILSTMAFAQPRPRKEALTYAQAEAVVAHALAGGRPSIALAQALQFECSLRQIDVIGEWVAAGDENSGIVDRGQRWTGGVQWADLSTDMILTKETSKTAALGEWNLRYSPLVVRALEAFPQASRIGPMIVSEVTGRPYRQVDFGKTWRAFATAAGLPRTAWNMDSRAGGITEGDEAGADRTDLQQHATHADGRTTSRYVRRTLASTENVARLRVARRTEEKP